MPWARVAHGVSDLSLSAVVSTHPNLQIGLMSEEDADISPGVPLCPGDDIYTGLSCVMQLFVFNAVVTDLPSPDAFETRTKEGDVVRWAWMPLGGSGESNCVRRRMRETVHGAASLLRRSGASWFDAFHSRITCWFQDGKPLKVPQLPSLLPWGLQKWDELGVQGAAESARWWARAAAESRAESTPVAATGGGGITVSAVAAVGGATAGAVGALLLVGAALVANRRARHQPGAVGRIQQDVQIIFSK